MTNQFIIALTALHSGRERIHIINNRGGGETRNMSERPDGPKSVWQNMKASVLMSVKLVVNTSLYNFLYSNSVFLDFCATQKLYRYGSLKIVTHMVKSGLTSGVLAAVLVVLPLVFERQLVAEGRGQG